MFDEPSKSGAEKDLLALGACFGLLIGMLLGMIFDNSLFGLFGVAIGMSWAEWEKNRRRSISTGSSADEQ